MFTQLFAEFFVVAVTMSEKFLWIVVASYHFSGHLKFCISTY